MLTLQSTCNLAEDIDKIQRWRCGRIVFQGGRFMRVEKRLLCGNVSMAQVWWQAKYGRREDDICWLDYHQPYGMPAFLTLDYIRAGSKAGYRSLAGAVHVLHEVARMRNASAIVAHVSNAKISDRFLMRMGWEQHLHQWNGRHWIRRFYNGYPEFHHRRFTDGIAGSAT